MPPAVVVIDCVPTAAPGGTAADNARVPWVVPLLPAVLWSVTVVPVPFHEAGKLYSNTGVVCACAPDVASASTAMAADIGVNVFETNLFILRIPFRTI